MHRAIQRGRRRFGGQGGFTLFEVVMVLLILGIISYFATTRLFSGDASLPRCRDGARQESPAVCPVAGHEFRKQLGDQVRVVDKILAFQGPIRQYGHPPSRRRIGRRGHGTQQHPGEPTLRQTRSTFDHFGSPGSSVIPYHRSTQGGRTRGHHYRHEKHRASSPDPREVQAT